MARIKNIKKIRGVNTMNKYKKIGDMLLDSTEPSKDMVEEFKTFTEEFGIECCKYLVHGEQEELLHKLNIVGRIQNLIRRNIQDEMNYYMGMFSGIYNEMKLLVPECMNKDNFESMMDDLYARRHVSDILQFIFSNPNSQHKDIMKAVHISSSYVSELLRELVEIRCLKKTGSGKFRFYELTMDGKRYVLKRKNADKKNVNHDFVKDLEDYHLKDYTSLSDAGEAVAEQLSQEECINIILDFSEQSNSSYRGTKSNKKVCIATGPWFRGGYKNDKNAYWDTKFETKMDNENNNISLRKELLCNK